jgi:hypothetical protein
MIGLANEGQAEASDFDDALDDVDRHVGGLEPRPLLDVELDVGGDLPRVAAGLGRPGEVEARARIARAGARSGPEGGRQRRSRLQSAREPKKP